MEYRSGVARTTGTELSQGPTRTSTSEPCPRLSPEPICDYENVDLSIALPVVPTVQTVMLGANLPNGLPSAGNNLSASGTSCGVGSVRPPALVKDDASVGFGSVRPPKRRRVVGKSSIARYYLGGFPAMRLIIVIFLLMTGNPNQRDQKGGRGSV